ncbi:MAG: hypothetical protein Q9171_004163 [Xanthocarpia ochracea]
MDSFTIDPSLLTLDNSTSAQPFPQLGFYDGQATWQPDGNVAATTNEQLVPVAPAAAQAAAPMSGPTRGNGRATKTDEKARKHQQAEAERRDKMAVSLKNLYGVLIGVEAITKKRDRLEYALKAMEAQERELEALRRLAAQGPMPAQPINPTGAVNVEAPPPVLSEADAWIIDNMQNVDVSADLPVEQHQPMATAPFQFGLFPAPLTLGPGPLAAPFMAAPTHAPAWPTSSGTDGFSFDEQMPVSYGYAPPFPPLPAFGFGVPPPPGPVMADPFNPFLRPISNETTTSILHKVADTPTATSKSARRPRGSDTNNNAAPPTTNAAPTISFAPTATPDNMFASLKAKGLQTAQYTPLESRGRQNFRNRGAKLVERHPRSVGFDTPTPAAAPPTAPSTNVVVVAKERSEGFDTPTPQIGQPAAAAAGGGDEGSGDQQAATSNEPTSDGRSWADYLFEGDFE